MNRWTLGRRLHLSAVATFAAILAERFAVFAVLAAALLLLARTRPEALKPLLARTFLLFAVLSLLFGALLLGPVPFAFSGEGALLGSVLLARAGVVITLSRWVSLDASPFEFAALGGRRGASLGFALGIALNALPALEDSARRTWDALRVRGGTRRHRSRNLRRFALATLANALRRADASAEVALSRGYSVERIATASAPGAQPGVPAKLGVRVILLAADLAAVGLLTVRFR